MLVKWLRLILIPVVPIYYIITLMRNWLYDRGLLKSATYDFPVICVGNLSTGGTGKTPMIEYLIRLLEDNKQLAILSRGYKRSTTGFVLAEDHMNYRDIGDEPFQMFKKFKDIYVAVDEKRTNGISKLRELDPQPELILLDDSYQHRKVKATLNILLTSYGKMFYNDIVLPTGNLREPRQGYKRADFIVVTKCPENMTLDDKERIIGSINPTTKQKVFFSSISYSEQVYGLNGQLDLKTIGDFTLVTGIANPQPLVDYLKGNDLDFDHLNYPDHYNFTSTDIRAIAEKPMVLTTEKDFVRLADSAKFKDNLYYLPIITEIDREQDFITALELAVKS